MVRGLQDGKQLWDVGSDQEISSNLQILQANRQEMFYCARRRKIHGIREDCSATEMVATFFCGRVSNLPEDFGKAQDSVGSLAQTNKQLLEVATSLSQQIPAI